MNEDSVVRKFRTTESDDKNYQTLFYNTDVQSFLPNAGTKGFPPPSGLGQLVQNRNFVLLTKKKCTNSVEICTFTIKNITRDFSNILLYIHKLYQIKLALYATYISIMLDVMIFELHVHLMQFFANLQN